MRIGSVVLAGALSLALPAVGSAQDEFDDAPVNPGAGGAGARSAEEAPPAAFEQPAGALTTEQPFDVKRGFFREGDLGIFFAFGGVNTNAVQPTPRSTSNLQPYMGITIGYDVAHGRNYNFALGGRFAMLLNGGAGRVSNAELEAGPGDPDPTTKSADFSIMQAGLAASLGIRLDERLALNLKADGGLALLDPDPNRAAAARPLPGTGMGAPIDGAGGLGIGGIFGVGAGVEYYTMLDGFSVGLFARFIGVVGDSFIPGLSVTVPIKYNF